MNISNLKYSIKKDTIIAIESLEMTTEDFAFKCGVSKRTIDGILSDEVNPNKKTLEKIYSYIYSKRLRINAVKEEIYKETTKSKVLFHGAKQKIMKITKNGSRELCDFGPAFYLGEDLLQARSFVCDYEDSSIYLFSCDMEDLKVYKFDCNLEWLLAICYYRQTIDKYKDSKIVKDIVDRLNKYDVLIAPIADNKMFYIMQLFANGDINSEVAVHSLSASSLGYQYVFKTTKAINKLKPIEMLYLCKEEKKDVYGYNIKRGELVESKLKISKRQFDGKGKYIDELL